MSKKGKVWLVGAGPSDPGLFTIKGKKVLEAADVVVYDKLVGHGILAMMPETAELIDVGKTAGKHPVPQDQINEILLEKAMDGKKVVRLKGGDPFVFGRGGEELELLLENDIEFEIVPGITSAVSVPMYGGIPVTHRDFASSFHVITGHRKKGAKEVNMPDFARLATLEGTLVFLMGISNMETITRGLIQGGMDENTPAAVLERGTTAHQRRVISTVGKLCEASEKAKVKTPAIIVVGKVCDLADKFSWAEKRPLGKVKVAITRPKDRISKLAEKIQEKGGEVLFLPAIKTLPLEDQSNLERALERISEYEIMAFTSPFGVKVFFEEMKNLKKDIRSLGNIKVAAIGSATKRAIEDKGLLVDYVPEIYSGEALGRLLAKVMGSCPEKKILLPRSAQGTDQVTVPLEKAGIIYDDVAIYTTENEGKDPVVGYEEDVDCVAFTSASTVRGFVETNYKVDYSKVRAFCIGEQTGKEAEKFGMEVYISDHATLDSLVECIEREINVL